MDKQELRNEWLEPVLTRHLGQVIAPDELWYRVHNNPPVPSAKSSVRQLAWALAATLAIVTVAWGFHARRSGLTASEALAIRSLERGQDRLEFRSGEVAQIRAWVETGTGIDIPLPSETPAAVQMLGAHVVKGAVPGVEVAYRVDDHDVVLLVSRAGSSADGLSKHRFLTSKGSRVSSWIMGGQLYTLACNNPGDIRAACVLCHVGAEGQTALN